MPQTVRLIRTVAFRAHHRLRLPEASPEENRARFSWTAESHPHDYRCTVTVAASLGDPDAFVVDLPVLDRLLTEEIVTPFEGRHLDRDVPELARLPVTCEALARLVFRRLANGLPSAVRLVCVRVAEDDTLAAEVWASDP